MAKRKEITQQKISNALGANRSFHVTESKLGTPLSWLKLSNDLKIRLVSRGGRPSDPYWDTKRLVPFRRKVWGQLSEQAKLLSQSGRKIGPAQLAAIIIESSLTKDVTKSKDFKIKINVQHSKTFIIQSFETIGAESKNNSHFPSSSSSDNCIITQSGISSQWEQSKEFDNLMYSITRGNL